jgi:hypothetical protein
MATDQKLVKVLQEELDRTTKILQGEPIALIEHRMSLSLYRVQLAEKIHKYSLPQTTDSVEEMLIDLGGPALDDPSSATSARS